MTDSSQSLPGVLARRLRPLQRVLDLVLPPRCLGCGELVERQGTLCVTCWAAIAFVTDPQCRCCGLPFAFDPGSDADVPRDEAVGRSEEHTSELKSLMRISYADVFIKKKKAAH